MRFPNIMIAAVTMVGVAFAQTHNFGPAIGVTLPSFSAQDQTGVARSSRELDGENGVVLLITRSADWCPFCRAQLIALEGVRPQIEARGWQLAAITTDTPQELARFAATRNIGFPMLSDEPAQIVRQLGLLDPTQQPNSRHNGLPVPTILFVSDSGVVRAKLGDANYRVRPAADVVIQTLDGLR